MQNAEIHAPKGDPGCTLLAVQEVTPESFEMMRAAPWWGRYMSSPAPDVQSYDTAIMYSKSQVTAAGPFQKYPFLNSRMGIFYCFILPALAWLFCYSDSLYIGSGSDSACIQRK